MTRTFSNNSPAVSIITPTYNRCHTLQRLFDSLERQGHLVHEWIVVDDGSLDETPLLIDALVEKKTNVKKIVYVKQPNQGKHVAINNGLDYVTGNYIVIVDSDDFLSDSCISDFLMLVDKHSLAERADIVGVSGSKVDMKGSRVSFHAETDPEIMTHHEWFYVFGRTGDRVDFYKKEALQNRRFAVFPGEKFLTEDAYWLTIPGSKLYTNLEMLHGDYLSDGLSAKYGSLLKKNPFGMAYYYYVLVNQYANCSRRPPFKLWLLLSYYFVLAVGKMSWYGAVVGIAFLPFVAVVKAIRK